MAELRIDASQLIASDITRVTMVAERSGTDLELNPVTGTFDGALILTIGTHTIVARAFAGDTLVGESRPTPVVIQLGVVTRVQIKILDLTNQTSTYGPIIDSLTFPTTAEAGSPVEFALSAVVPGGGPLTYAWSSDCPDAVFSAPAAASTTWSTPTEGTCRIHATVTAGGITVDSLFSIVVFPQLELTGAADASGVFVDAPVVRFSLRRPECNLSTGGDNASCANAIASPTVAEFTVSVLSWGGSAPGPIEVTQDCGGRLAIDPVLFDSVHGYWLPPVDRGVCILTARVENRDGATATLAPGILVRSGTPPTITSPMISARFFGFSCMFDGTSSPVDCGLVPANSAVSVEARRSVSGGTLGPGSFSDDCGGGMDELSSGTLGFSRGWRTPPAPGRICTTTIRSTSAEGGESVATARYQLQ